MRNPRNDAVAVDELADIFVTEADSDIASDVIQDEAASDDAEALDGADDGQDDDDQTERGEIRDPEQADARERSSLAILIAELSATSLLSREEEQRIGRGLVRSRNAIRRLLGTQPGVVDAAVPPQRSSIDPRQDFRERETIAVLTYTDQLLLRNGDWPSELDRDVVRRFRDDLAIQLERYREYRDQLIRGNVRLVISLARRYRRNGVALSDMVQEGVLGLVRAVEKYDPIRDVKFATYAVWWIWQQIGRAGDVHAALIRTPVHWNQLRRKLGRETVRLEHIAGGNIGREELAEAAGIDTDRLDAVTQGFFCVSLDSPTTEADDRPLREVLASPTADPEREQAVVDLGARLESALSQLPRREADILRLRFGTSSSHALTLEEVGQMLGVSRERVRQLEARALRLLLPICQNQGLRAYFD